MNAIFHPLTYEEWIKRHPEIKDEEESCVECDGSGETECHECGTEIDCGECNGTGKVKSARAAYQEQLRKDRAAFERLATT